MPPRAEHLNGGGAVHGGLLATLADLALCAAVNDAPASTAVATAGLSITYQRPVTPATGEVRATGRVLHRATRTATVVVRVTDADGVLYAHAVGTVVLTAA